MRVLKRRGDLRILLRLNQDPALVAVLNEEGVGLGEIDGAVAGDCEHAGEEGVEEGTLGHSGLFHLGGAHVLEVHVLDTVDRAAQQAHDVAVAHERVPVSKTLSGSVSSSRRSVSSLVWATVPRWWW